METRNVTVTLEKAKEWYNSGNTTLKEVALQAFSEKELKVKNFTDIKTLEDVCEALNMDYEEFLHMKACLGDTHLRAIYMLDLIRKALNGDWKPSLITGNVYYPYVRFYPANEARARANENNWVAKESFIADGKKYTLVGGDYGCFSCGGLGYFGSGSGDVRPYLGLFGYKSEEVAKHMSKYFAKEIFDATYAHHKNYKWV